MSERFDTFSPPPPEPDPWTAAGQAEEADEGGALDPRATVLHLALGGRSSPRRRLEGIVFAAIWICVYVFRGALHHAGASNALAYGIYPAVAPLLIVGSAAAGYEAARGKRASAGFALAAVVLAAISSFAGPATVWGVIGVGLCVLLVAATAAQLWERRPRA